MSEQHEGTPESRLEQLQETALRLEVDIFDEHGAEISFEALEKLVIEAQAQIDAEEEGKEREQVPPSNTGSNRPPIDAVIGPGDLKPPALPGAKAAAEARKVVEESIDEAEKFKSRFVTAARADLCQLLGLGEPSDADYALAKKHGFNVAIPGAKVYRSKISMIEVFSGLEVPAGDLILLIDAHVANKAEYLTLVDEPEEVEKEQEVKPKGKTKSPPHRAGRAR